MQAGLRLRLEKGPMEVEPHKQRTLGRPRAEADLARLNRRFRAITRRQERARFRHRLYRALGWWVLAALCMASLLRSTPDCRCQSH